MTATRTFIAVLFFVPGLGAGEANADLVLVKQGGAGAVIHHSAAAPETARLAAKELQHVIRRATGAELRITSNATSPAIRLVSDGALPHDGFEIRAEGQDLIIAGNDDLAPPAPDVWFVPSHGTLFGAYEFLERFVGVRWLFPGELGEDVPHHDTLAVSLPAAIRGAPDLAVRSLAYVGESDKGTTGRPRSAVLEWMKRQRLTNALHPLATGYGHSWDDYLTPADMEAHPEWKSSNGEAVRNGRVKFFCTTAPGLIQAFSRRVIESIDRNPNREMTSISPTDGGGFCTCERCAKLLAEDPHGRVNHSLAILTFYKQVAEVIQRERPGRRLGGFVYYNYQYPPSTAPALPDNLSLCWAPLNYYGYGLLKPVYGREFERVMQRWSGITAHLFYHNYSTWMRSFHGAPLPPSIGTLQRELPVAAKYHAWGARMVGTSAWGVNAPINYILSKQMWNAGLDVGAVLDEWLQRAYGSGWRHMRQLDEELDMQMRSHKEAQSPVYRGSQYEVNEDVMKNVYAPLFPAMELHYSSAVAECGTETQRQRLAMFGDNLTQLHFALRKAGLIPAHAQSIFRLDDADFASFMSKMESSFSLYRDDLGIDHGPIWKGEWRAP